MILLNAKQSHQQVNYILGIDGGGTKTIARLINIETQEQWLASAGPSSLNNDFSGAIGVLEKLIKEVTTLSCCELNDISAVFGLAGAGNDKLVASLQQVFANRFAYLAICSDAKTSAYGANNGDEVAVVALGTGSVGMRLQRNAKGDLEQHLVGGWGFLIGDEGGGARLGYYSVKALVEDVQQYGRANTLLTKTVAEHICPNLCDRTTLLTWLSQASPANFAKLSTLVTQLFVDCPVAKQIIDDHVSHVELLICNTRGDSQLPVVLMGGLAQVTYKLLSPKIQAIIVKAKGDSLDGACLLATRAGFN